MWVCGCVAVGVRSVFVVLMSCIVSVHVFVYETSKQSRNRENEDNKLTEKRW